MAFKIKNKYILFLIISLLFLANIYTQDTNIEQSNDIVIPENAVLLDNGTIVLEDGTIVDAITLLPIEEKDYVIQETSEGVIFIQTLSWVSSEYALRYEVRLEKQLDDGTWISENTYTTDINEVEVSLFAGTYRYQILVYNFLDLLEDQSDWFEFDVFKAIQPRVADLGPDIIYLDEIQTGVFSFEGFNALDETLFYLQIPNSPRRTMYGDIIEQNDENFRILFNMRDIDVGDYEFVAENPGGLTDKISPLVVKFLKPYDLNVTVGYNMFYTIPGDIPLYFNESFFPFGASAKLTYIPLKRNFGNIGFEVSAYWYYMKSNFDSYDITTHVIPATLNFVYQLPIIKKRLILDAHIGGGATLLTNLKFKYSSGIESPAENPLGIAANAGLSLQLYPLTQIGLNRLYFELGTDYIVSFFQDTILHIVTPALSVGWQF